VTEFSFLIELSL